MKRRNLDVRLKVHSDSTQAQRPSDKSAVSAENNDALDQPISINANFGCLFQEAENENAYLKNHCRYDGKK